MRGARARVTVAFKILVLRCVPRGMPSAPFVGCHHSPPSPPPASRPPSPSRWRRATAPSSRSTTRSSVRAGRARALQHVLRAAHIGTLPGEPYMHPTIGAASAALILLTRRAPLLPVLGRARGGVHRSHPRPSRGQARLPATAPRGRPRAREDRAGVPQRAHHRRDRRARDERVPHRAAGHRHPRSSSSPWPSLSPSSPA